MKSGILSFSLWMMLLLMVQNPLFAQRTVWGDSPKYTPKLNPHYDPDLDPKYNSDINPTFNRKIDPNYESSLNPKWNSEIDPKLNAKVNPNFNSTLNPQFNTKLNPKFAQGTDPYNGPWKGQFLFDAASDWAGTLVEASPEVLTMFSLEGNWINYYVRAGQIWNEFTPEGQYTGRFLVSDSRSGYNLFDTEARWTGWHVK